MRALQLEKPETWKLLDIPSPSAVGADEALVRVHRVGVCGTDIGCYLGKFPFFAFPRIPGHELGVEVAEIGEGVEHLKVGDRCCVEPYLNCGECYACKRGFTNCCEHNQTFGVMCDGGLTEYVVLPARKVHPAPRLTYEQAALVETLAIGCHAVDRASPKPHETILVLGAGPIGLSALEFAKLSNARVLVADLSPGRLEFVKSNRPGIETVLFHGDSRDHETIHALTEGRLSDIVIDATGNHRSMVRALEFAAFAGRVVFVGITQMNLDFPHAPFLHRRELSILASRNAPSKDFARIVQLIDAGAIDTKPWITHHATMEEVPHMFADWLNPTAGVIKAMIHIT
jgi:2-desacetyl-2-hydroxyethyl bacteriochlorophyllide A dehydrogenase